MPDDEDWERTCPGCLEEFVRRFEANGEDVIILQDRESRICLPEEGEIVYTH